MLLFFGVRHKITICAATQWRQTSTSKAAILSPQHGNIYCDHLIVTAFSDIFFGIFPPRNRISPAHPKLQKSLRLTYTSYTLAGCRIKEQKKKMGPDRDSTV
jgi:hypothetical protein